MVTLTPPPTATKDHNDVAQVWKRATPKINGSSGGFIALVACLCIVIVMSCSALYYLLRNHEPTDAERAARKERKYQTNSNSGSKASPKTWIGQLRNVFSSRGRPVQAASPGDWDYHAPAHQRQVSQTTIPAYTVPVSIPVPLAPTPSISPARPPLSSVDSTTSILSVRFQVPASRSTSHHSHVHPQSMSATLSNAQLTEAPRTSSPEHIQRDADSVVSDSEENPRRKETDRSTSTTSVHRFSGGTKFIEAL